MSSYEELLTKQRREFTGSLLRHVKRLNWSATAISEERERNLRELLSFAMTHSPFHRDRLGGLDIDQITAADLPELPSMTKDDVMNNFDAIVTDPELSLALVNDHIETLDSDAYLLDQYRALATGGSSGRRGIFVYGWSEWITVNAIMNRWLVRREIDARRPQQLLAVGVLAGKASHISGSCQSFFQADHSHSGRIGAGLPTGEIVKRLNAVQPESITTYPSTLRMLVDRSRAGKLRIEPREIMTTGEQLPDSLRADVFDLWGVDVYDYWGATEGVFAFPCELNVGKHLPDDLVIVEAVDENGIPVPAGTPAAKVFVTNLYNKTQPLIRYEIPDSLTLLTEPCSCGRSFSRITDLRGRLSDSFEYSNGTKLSHLPVIFDPLERNRDVVDFQVTQTLRGANILVYSSGDPDIYSLELALVASLEEAGLRDPEIMIEVKRDAALLPSGKLRHFIPLTR